MEAKAMHLKQEVIRILDDLSAERIAEVLDFALFLQSRQGQPPLENEDRVKSSPAAELRPLVGLIAVGGDAVVDSDRLYSDE